MERQLKSAQLKKRIALENMQSLECFRATFSEDSGAQIPEASERLEKYKSEFYAAMTELEELDDSIDAIDASVADRVSFENRYYALKSFMRERRPTEPVHESPGMANSTAFAFGRPNAPNVRLPKIELPTFDGDSTKWLSFRDRFVTMIDASTEIPSIVKLQYLLSSLTGEAAVPFEHVSVTSDNYDQTWAALLRRYDNKRMLVREYYRQLHHLPAVSSQCVTELAKLVDGFSRLVHGLRKLKEPIESWDTPLSNLLLFKLDDATILAWENHSVHFGKDIYNDLISFIEDRIQILKATSRFNEGCSNASSKGVSPIKVAGGRQSASQRTIAHAATTKVDAGPQRAVQQPRCALGCLDSHLLRTCSVFNGKDVQDRRKVVSSNGLCWNCLSPSHQVKQCRSEFSCRLCSERHHTLLHVNPGSSTVTMSVQSDDDKVFLETVWLTLIDDHGNKHDARALLDSGSMSNFISESLARQLITTRNKVNISVSGIGKTRQMVKGTLSTTVQSRIRPYSATMEFLVLDTPASAIPTTFIDVSTWHIPDVPLADSTFHIPGNIDIVIGGDMYWELHSGHKRSLGNGKPWLVETPFGWVVTGNSASNSTTHSTCHFAATDTSLESFMERFWQGETITQEPTLSAEEQICETLYTTTTTRDSSGWYTVKLPFKSNTNLILGTSKEVADRRLMSVERRLKGNPKMKEAYQKFMNECEQLGHMKRLTEPIDDSVQHYYIPHHAVVKEASTTTKVRVVFDASCKTSAGTSLDDMLLVGPVVQQEVYAIMLRFRSHPIALVAHVERMYRQILHDASSRKYLRIRYRDDPSQLQDKWRKFHHTLDSLRELKIPRFVSQRKSTSIQLHVFADASQNAYGTCCYVRAETSSGISTQLFTAKSKVVSLTNSHSLARLELCVARLATQLAQGAKAAMSEPLIVFCWTDSLTVLHWLHSPPRRCNPFVANRVAQIQGDSDIKSWRHVPGLDNPADDISRGLLPDKLLTCQRWWQGPHWLSHTEEPWPQGGTETLGEGDQSEERSTSRLVAVAATNLDFSSKLFSRFSSYLKLKRTTAYWQGYIQRLKEAVTVSGSPPRGAHVQPLSKDELQCAEIKLCQLAQQNSFAEEIKRATARLALIPNQEIEVSSNT